MGFKTNKEFKPYSGLWVYPVILIAVPAVLYFFFYLVLSNSGVRSISDPSHDAFLISALVSMMFCVLTVLGGALTWPFLLIVKRVSEFVRDVFSGMSVKSAFSWYVYNVKEDGLAFWVILASLSLDVVYLIWVLKHFYPAVS